MAEHIHVHIDSIYKGGDQGRQGDIGQKSRDIDVGLLRSIVAWCHQGRQLGGGLCSNTWIARAVASFGQRRLAERWRQKSLHAQVEPGSVVTL